MGMGSSSSYPVALVDATDASFKQGVPTVLVEGLVGNSL